MSPSGNAGKPDSSASNTAGSVKKKVRQLQRQFRIAERTGFARYAVSIQVDFINLEQFCVTMPSAVFAVHLSDIVYCGGM